MRKASSGEPPPAEPITPQRILSRPEKLETYVLALVLQGKTAEHFEELREHVSIADFSQPAVRTIFNHLEKFLEGKRVFLLKDFADSLPAELTPVLDEASLWDISDFVDDEEKFSRVWEMAVRELRRAILKRRIREYGHKIQESARKDTDGGEKAIERLQKDLKECTVVLAALDKSG